MPVAQEQGVLSGFGGDLCKPDPCQHGDALATAAASGVLPAGPSKAASDRAGREAGTPRSWGRALARWAPVIAGLLVGCGPPGRQDLLEGQRLLSAGRPDAAVPPLQEAVRSFATNALARAQAWNYLGIAYHQLGHAENAALCYKAALEHDLNLFAARYNRGFLYFERTNYAAAINELTTFTTQLPDDPAGWLLLGKAQLRAGLIEPAQQSLQRVRRLPSAAPDQAEAFNALGVSYARRRKAPEAFQHFEAALNRVPDYPPAILNQAIFSQQVGDRNFALQKYQAYLEVAAGSPKADVVRALTNQLVLALIASKPPPATPPATAQAKPPPEPEPASPVLAARDPSAGNASPTSPPPAVVQAPPPSPPPATVTTSTAPALVVTSPSPAVVQTAALPVLVARQESPAPEAVVGDAPPSPPPDAGDQPSPGEPPAVERPSSEPPVAASLTTEVEATPEPPLETVEVEPEPDFQPARDVALVSTDVPQPAPAAAVPEEPVTTDAATDEPKKRSFFSRLNPVGWFGSKDSDPEKAQARAAEAQAAEQEKARRAAEKEAEKARKRAADTARRAPAPSPPPRGPAPPSAPVFARYVYSQPTAPQPGDRAASDQLLKDGLRAHQAGRVADAQMLYAKAAQADPASFNAQFNLAVAAFDLGDWTRSLAAYEQALAIAPDDVRARYGLALALERAGYPLDAADELERAVGKDPANVQAHLAAANLYATTLADVAKARGHYTRVLELQPSHPQAAMIRRWLGPLPR